MSASNWGVSHIETLKLLPPELEKGRAYFIDDEGYIIIDHGRGPVTYGNRPGPQGEAGEPIPQLQDQIDYLTQAVFNILTEINELTHNYDNAINILAATISNLYPESHSSEWKEIETTDLIGETLTTEEGLQYQITNAYLDGEAQVVVLEVANIERPYVMEQIQVGEKVEFNNTTWTVKIASQEHGMSYVVLEIG